ncbi:lipopolysaccharide kinase InaA family protein [Tamlana sp. 2_MG-2023]|uniref:lipopolysaccharide kinase InaA family protein n=1 Tax=unclassified Tamlana TaxID=2614803 RepID=UPI0026E4132E|nr:MULTISPECIES: lipopolysaccharide kinase InaA family protein [unclassified Tamlana]MDO6759069.1 lipopolysaccharide kinase InaA family protein [Tamlana sp. 2_MG-2023]MDO6789768.1 lipopolysaccharide kinase InaA family protein [Tamlana sp. 1_MG-2023]
MNKKQQIKEAFKNHTQLLDKYILNFDDLGEDFGNQDRNSLKLFKLEDQTINVKSFRVPNLVNQIAYKFFRKSKAQRSYEYASRLKALGIGTPNPIAYYEFETPFLFKKSYYISAHLDYDLTYRELTTDFNIPNYEAILRAFTRFTFNLHEKGIHFLDHSPGNTLIQLNGGDYKFYLVDLNRMEFKTLDFETRIKNFSRLTIHKSMVEIMSDEYAKCSGEAYDKVFQLMWKETEDFQDKYHRKRRLKKKFKFWKSSS